MPPQIVKAKPRNQTMEPRRYQLELLEYVQQRNGIIYLPTGSGKTFVAIMALKRFSHQMQNTIENGGKRAIFMCNTIELARQQATEVRDYTNLKVGFYTGERNVDEWTRKQWEDEIKENQVLVGTAQIFLDIVCQNYIKISDLSIVIIDECHHGTKNHPMQAFMRIFQDVPDKTQLPRVIGLTGVLIKGNKLNKIQEELHNLEATYRGYIVTVGTVEEYQNVMLYSTKPTESLVTYTAATYSFPLVNEINKIINDCLLIIDAWDLGKIQLKQSKNLNNLREPNKKNYVKNLMKDFIYQMDEFGLYAAAIAIMSPIIALELKKRQSETVALRNMYRFVISKCELIRHLLIQKLKDDDKDEDVACHTIEIILNYATPKLRALLSLTKKTFVGKKPEDISCLIFVERRYTAKCIYYVLQKYIELEPALKDVLKPQFMVGRNNVEPSIESILENKWNKKAIDSFRTGECNLLVCSNVLEEGIDVQSCNYVFAFDPLKTFNSYIQTKGRARSKGAIYAIFAPSLNETKVVEQIRNYKKAHGDIQSYLLKRVLNRDEPEEQILQLDDIIPPFVIPSGARLCALNALSLLNRYCQQLPMDAFGVATPWFTKEILENTKHIRIRLQMPIQSTVKETIYSNPYTNAKLGKISAAMKVCMKLYEEGELNDHLLPVTKRECVAKVSEVLFDHWRQFNDDVTFKQAGKKSCRLYEHKYPDQLSSAVPSVGEECYAYEVKTIPQFEVTDYTKHIDELLTSNRSYAILTRKKLPTLAEMPLFMNQGKLSVKISHSPLVLKIESEKQMEQLKKYHLMIFRDILECWKSFFVLDRRNQENAYLIVPLRDGQLDWELVENFQRILPQRKYSITERQKKIYRPEDYLGKIVNKWYSGRDNQRFVVTKVLTDMTPMSPFDNDEYKSFAHFIDCRYKDEVERVVQSNQFMLEVRELTNRRNFFINAVGKNSKVHKNNCAIHLIPELCHNFMYPGDLWLKACLLPSILHRVHFMLHAEELRVRVNKFLGIKCDSYVPLTLQIDKSLSRVVDFDGNAIEDHEEQRKMLPTLPTRAKNSDFKITALSDDTTWKEYLEPGDISRNTNSIYPVDLEYYYKFIRGLELDFDALKITEDTEWNYCQLDMPKTKSSPTNLNNLPISDVPLADKRRIKILERTLGQHVVQTAEQHEFLAAITTAGANDVIDMERFEFLGDSFLKFSISLYLVNRYPKWHEGFLTEVKSKLVSNRNLLYCMLNTDIPGRICGYLFKPPHEWLPPMVSLPHNLLELFQNNTELLTYVSPNDLYAMELDEDEVLSGECSAEHISCVISSSGNIVDGTTADANFENDLNLFVYKEPIRDKIIADTMEAILGVCVKNYGIYETFRMLEFFKICKAEPNQPLTHLMDLKLGSQLLHANISTREVDSFLINYQKLEENLGYKFRDRAYLLQALTHPSYPTNRITGCYQELEFIGDAILDFLISCYIFERYNHMTPGMLTDLRAALVNNVTLGCVCVRHRFHYFMLAENSALAESVKNFAAYQEKQKHQVTDQVYILMEENVETESEETGKTYNLSVNVDVPKALGDILEALIAAVYLDSRDLHTTWNVIYHLLEQELNQFIHAVPIDAVRQLNDHKHANPKYSQPIVDNDTVMVKCQFTCLDMSFEVNGFGVNSVQAKKAAAKHALKILAKHSS